ncbi:unnamed protein product [Euphydryas editha]|uniref:Large neutral amino acids transporter small subunit 2 n=2 Tax=Euphydryas editha TaxID=104508 RepID=A0AAU9V2P7_EUPED|nr:unnamed protein product [Euphydryas editha]
MRPPRGAPLVVAKNIMIFYLCKVGTERYLTIFVRGTLSLTNILDLYKSKERMRNLPRAIWIAMPMVTIIYVMANLAYFAVVPKMEMMSNAAVAAVFGDRLFAGWSWLIPVFVALSTFGGVNGVLFTSARLFATGAQEGHMPGFFTLFHVDKQTPIPSLIFTCFFSLLMLTTSNVFDLINYFSQTLWISVGASVVGMLWLRRAKPDMPRPIKVNLIIPYLFLIAIGFLVFIPAITSPKDTAIGLAILLSGVPVYYICVKWKGKPECYHAFSGCLLRFMQKLCACNYVDSSEKLSN